MTTLSKLKQEGREEFEGPEFQVLNKYDKYICPKHRSEKEKCDLCDINSLSAVKEVIKKLKKTK